MAGITQSFLHLIFLSCFCFCRIAALTDSFDNSYSAYSVSKSIFGPTISQNLSCFVRELQFKTGIYPKEWSDRLRRHIFRMYIRFYRTSTMFIADQYSKSNLKPSIFCMDFSSLYIFSIFVAINGIFSVKVQRLKFNWISHLHFLLLNFKNEVCHRFVRTMVWNVYIWSERPFLKEVVFSE